MILQKNGKATPSVAATLVQCLPDEGDPQRSGEEMIARNVALVAYAGTCPVVYIANFEPLADYFMRFVSAGADTVSKRNEKILLYH
jgi:hypothetical protein